MRAALACLALCLWAAPAAVAATPPTELTFDAVPVGTTMAALGLPGVALSAVKRAAPATACGGRSSPMTATTPKEGQAPLSKGA